MIRSLLFNIAFIMILVPAQAQFGKILDKAKSTGEKIIKGEDTGADANISAGLKEALNSGVSDAVESLSAKDGYFDSVYKIETPSEAQKVISKVKRIPGFQNVEAELEQKMNEAAEVAAKKATPIFVDAIKEMSFKDASKILFGEDNAGTNYLENSSRDNLYKEFMPVIQAALQEVNATKYWKSVVSKYNSIPLVKKLNPDLDDHVNSKALDGLFSLIQVKEKGIREDIGQRDSPLLKDVFGRLD